MAVVIEEGSREIRVEAYAPIIRIRGNPVDDLAGVIDMDLELLEFQDGELKHRTPFHTSGEVVSDFIGRTFDIDGVTVTGLQVVQVVKRYVADVYAAHAAAAVEPTAE